MQLKAGCLFFGFLLMLTMSACSGIKKHFPDKEKDYQFSTEIPDLTVPPDLTDNATQDTSKENNVHDETSLAVSENIKITPSQSNTEDEAGDEATNEDDDYFEEEVVEEPVKELVYIELVEFSGGATRIRIEAPFERIWRIVGKAISRHSLEILERNETDRMYVIKYDADFKKVEDGSLWDEVVFIFGADPAQEKTYKIKVVENGGLIEVIVLDENNKPLSKGAGLELLNLLYNSMKQDLNGDLE
jgi:outer membrane protein assembly factor BamC